MDSVASVDHKEGNNENKEDSAEGGQRVESQGREEDSTLLDVEPAGDSDDNEGSLYDYPLGSDLEASQTGESNVVVFSHPGGDVEVGAAESENHLWVEFHILMLAFGGMVQDHKAIAMLCLLGLPLLLLIFPSQEPGGSVRWWKRSPLFWCVTECTVTRACNIRFLTVPPHPAVTVIVLRSGDTAAGTSATLSSAARTFGALASSR